MAKQELQIRTEDGTATAAAFRPETVRTPGKQPGVIVYMDAFGLRPALDAMAERLARAGLSGVGSRPLLSPRRLWSVRCQVGLFDAWARRPDHGHDPGNNARYDSP